MLNKEILNPLSVSDDTKKTDTISTPNNMILCSKCNHQNQNLSMFCTKCGCNLGKNSKTKEVTNNKIFKIIIILIGIFIIIPIVTVLLFAGTCLAIVSSPGH